MASRRVLLLALSLFGCGLSGFVRNNEREIDTFQVYICICFLILINYNNMAEIKLN